MVAGAAVTLHDLWQLGGGGGQAFGRALVARYRDADEGGDGVAGEAGVDRGVVAGDDASFLEAEDSLFDGGRGEAYAAAELSEGQAGVALEFGEDLPGDLVQTGL